MRGRRTIQFFFPMAVMLIGQCCVISGCRFLQTSTLQRPHRHTLETQRFVFHSNFEIADEHPLIIEMQELQHQVTTQLKLSPEDQQISVYIFENEPQYRKYIQAAYPQLPSRRAYFIKTRHALMVYTFWGERIQEDLRHELTHGLLHASLKNVPLWVDEGLAEYFEVREGTPGRINSNYVEELNTALENGWSPDFQRLDQLEHVEQMHQIDYQESWAWIHLMLHGHPELRGILLQYLQDLQANPNPKSLSQRLTKRFGPMQGRLASHILNQSVSQVSYRESPQ